MIKYEDPLTLAEVEVTDVATAYYVLKHTNDLHFAIHYMGENMNKEYSRNVQENFTLEHDLVAPYLETDTTVTSEGYVYTVPLRDIPKPLPASVPQKIKEAVEYLDAQLELDRERLTADLNEGTAPLKESLEILETKARDWFKSEVENGADWLGGARKAVLSGCTLSYEGGGVSFEYTEMDFGD